MSWIYLVLAGILEIGWAVGLKYTVGFTRLVPSIVTLLIMAASFYLLSLAVRTIPIGTGYAVWTGIGTVGAVLVGMWVFGEPKDALRLFFVAMILAGMAGLKLTA